MDSHAGDDTVDVLTEALMHAADAHGVYESEELGGQYHSEWHRWYAEHIAMTFSENGYRIVRTSE